MRNALTENQKQRLEAYRAQPEFRAILETLARAVRRPKYKEGVDPAQQFPDMVHRSGCAKGALEALSVLYDKDLKKEFTF